WYKYFCADIYGAQWQLGCFYMAASAALVAIIFIDGEHFIIPDEINAFLLILGVGYALYSKDWTFLWQGYLMGWGIIFGIAFFGRLAFGKDAMGHGDIKMMRGVGSLIGPVLCVFDVAIAVVTGLVFGILFIAIQASRDKKAALAASAEGDVKEATGTEEEDDYQPESIKDLLILGFSYLICLDVIAINFPQVYTKMGYPMEEVSVEDDDWEPSLTTIPFGPYLAVGAIACMIFGSYMNDYAAPVLKSLFG
ncbi:MAG TPA: A24 family peptidase, partial [Fimbriimonas sp.]|nr:A24 family peptidase [Fimbriimonas sp.]